MLSYYLKTAFRFLRKQKTGTLINIGGLSMGLCACLLIFQYVFFELSFDRFHVNRNSVYRIINDRYQNGVLIQHGVETYSGIGRAMKENFPEVKRYTKILPFNGQVILCDNRKFFEKRVFAADSSFLQIFSFPLLAGDRSSALTEPHSVIITEKLAGKLFSSGIQPGEVVGKFIRQSDDTTPYRITGVLRDLPRNSHLQADLFFSFSTIIKNGWVSADFDFSQSGFITYVQLFDGARPEAVEQKMDAFNNRYFTEYAKASRKEKFFLQPLNRVNLYSDFEFEYAHTGNATVVWGLLLSACLILAMGCINYINLATARSMDRAKEAGIRKSSGAERKHLILQFLFEAFLVNGTALLLALFLVLVLQKPFNALIGENLSMTGLFFSLSAQPFIALAVIGLLVVCILFSAFYPALVLSSYAPAISLRGKFSHAARGILMRKISVITQFAVMAGLISCTLIVIKQLWFTAHAQLGINLSQVLILRNPSLTNWDSLYLDKTNAFINELEKIPGVASAASSWRIPGDELPREAHVRKMGEDENKLVAMRNNGVSKDFLKTYSLKLLAGRDFEETDYASNWQQLKHVLITKSGAGLLGYEAPGEAVGKIILIQNRPWEIIGVINDFHQKSLHDPVEPTILNTGLGTFCPFSVKLKEGNIPAAVSKIEKTYNDFFPGNIFDYSFLDEQFNAQYKNDQLFGTVCAIFAVVSICIGSLGLLGLALYTIERRTKEIGVRKTLGASETDLVLLLSQNFLKLVAVALLIALPGSYLIMHKWLTGFVYRIELEGWSLIFPALIVLFFAFTTVGWLAYQAAKANPVKSLRSE